MSDPIRRRTLLAGLVAAAGAAALPRALSATPLAKVKENGLLRVGVYSDNRPWSWNDGGKLRGIDVDLAMALAAQLGVKADVAEFNAGDDMAADLRNVVWRGGLLGFRPCDVMMHVPFDHQLQLDNDQVAIVAPYYREGFAIVCGNEADDCEVPPPQFKGKRLAAETATLSDGYLVGNFGGTLRGDVQHFRTGYEAMAAVGGGKADVAMGTRAQAEAALHDFAGAQPETRMKRRKGPIPAMVSPGWDIAMAVKENSRTLSDSIETILPDMINTGQMAALFAGHGVEWHPALAG